jgi:hypothetical protein
MKKMGNELIPELHDCLKLTILQHTFSDFDRFVKYSPNTRTWNGVIQHHCKIPKEGEDTFPAWPTDRETFLLHMADGFASGFSRHGQNYKGEKSFVLHKLWNPKQINEDLRLKKDDEIIELLKFYGSDPDFKDLKAKYGHILLSRAEDAHPGMNITSLLTHLSLTGKFYRVLKNSEILQVYNSEIGHSVEGVSKLTERKSREWKLYLARFKFYFNQNPFRARDLNIFDFLRETITEIEKIFPDNILFASSNEILMFYDNHNEVMDKIRDIAIKNSMFLSIEYGYRPIEEIKKPDPTSLSGCQSENIYFSLPDSVPPPICEICQMAPAEKLWPTDYNNQCKVNEDIIEGTEHLCGNCFQVRSRPSRLRKLSQWTEESGDVLWLKITLDYECLTKTLQKLYYDYLKQNNPNAKEKDAEVRFSLIYEFQQDYDNFLKQISSDLLRVFSDNSLESIMPDLYCIKTSGYKDIFKLLRLIGENMNKSFPEFKKFSNGPIKLGIAHSRAKFPFFEIWRELKEQTCDLLITLIGHGIIMTSLKYIDNLLAATEESYRKSAFYKLAEISKLSEKLAELKFNDKKEKSDFEDYETLKRNLLPLGMDFHGILTFIKLLEE